MWVVVLKVTRHALREKKMLVKINFPLNNSSVGVGLRR